MTGKEGMKGAQWADLKLCRQNGCAVRKRCPELQYYQELAKDRATESGPLDLFFIQRSPEAVSHLGTTTQLLVTSEEMWYIQQSLQYSNVIWV